MAVDPCWSCEICGSTTSVISDGSTLEEDDFVGYEVVCASCGAAGYAWYELMFCDMEMRSEPMPFKCAEFGVWK